MKCSYIDRMCPWLNGLLPVSLYLVHCELYREGEKEEPVLVAGSEITYTNPFKNIAVLCY